MRGDSNPGPVNSLQRIYVCIRFESGNLGATVMLRLTVTLHQDTELIGPAIHKPL